MIGRRRFDVIEHLSEVELDTAIDEVQKADEARLVRRLCFVKNLYAGDVHEETARRVGVSQANSSRWAHAWNDLGLDGLRPSFGGDRPPKLYNEQFAELCIILEDGQPWTPRAIHTLIKEQYGVTYDPAHLSRKLRASGMQNAKPHPMDPRSPENADEILAERLAKALGRRRYGSRCWVNNRDAVAVASDLSRQTEREAPRPPFCRRVDLGRRVAGTSRRNWRRR